MSGWAPPASPRSPGSSACPPRKPHTREPAPSSRSISTSSGASCAGSACRNLWSTTWRNKSSWWRAPSLPKSFPAASAVSSSASRCDSPRTSARSSCGGARWHRTPRGNLPRSTPYPCPTSWRSSAKPANCSNRFLDSMPLELRAVFVLYEMEELSMADIAILLQIPPGSVASRLRRAREQFQERVRRYQTSSTTRGHRT